MQQIDEYIASICIKTFPPFFLPRFKDKRKGCCQNCNCIMEQYHTVCYNNL